MADQNLSRRGFIQAGAVVAAGTAVLRTPGIGAAVALDAAAGTTPDVPIKLGVASYSLRKFSRAAALPMVKALGTPFVNLKSVHLEYNATPEEFAAARQELAAAGLQVVGGGTITFSKDTDEDVRKYFDYAKAAGMPLMTSTADPAILPRIERFAKQYDIKVAIHNHGPEDKRYPSPYDVLKYVNGMDPRMGLCIDVGHTARTGTDIVRSVADAGPRLLDMHIKDLRDTTAKASQCIVGEGVLPIADLFRELQRIKYAGYVNLEYEIDADDPLAGMQRSFAYMRGVLAGLISGERQATH
jgi:sugar phosphate isomerase/epimerase